MKVSAVVLRILLFIFLLTAAGCGQLVGRSGRTSKAGNDLDKLSAFPADLDTFSAFPADLDLPFLCAVTSSQSESEYSLYSESELSVKG